MPTPATPPDAEKLVEFYCYEQIGLDVCDPETKQPLTEFRVGQKVVTAAGIEPGWWEFTVTSVPPQLHGENEHILLVGYPRTDGTWGATFISKKALERVNLT